MHIDKDLKKAIAIVDAAIAKYDTTGESFFAAMIANAAVKAREQYDLTPAQALNVVKGIAEDLVRVPAALKAAGYEVR